MDNTLIIAAERVATGANAHKIREAMNMYVVADALGRDAEKYEQNLRLTLMKINGIP